MKTRVEKLEELKQWFLANLVEDPIDGTAFDCAVLDSVEALKERFEA